VLARVQQSTGDLGQARASLGRLSGEHPNAIAPHLAMAEIQAMEQQWDAARASVRRALALRPDYLPGHMALVEIGVRAGAFDEALTAARAIQTRWPRSGAGHAAEASVLAARQDPAGAEKVLRAGLAASGDPALAVTLHRQLLARDRGGEADSELQAWLARTTGAPAGVLLAAGDSWQAKRDHTRAAAWYRRAVEANPKDAVALNNLAWELGQLGNREALDIARRALEQAPRSAPVLDTMGVLSLQFGEPADGVRHLEQAVQQAPQVPGFRVNLARALIRAGRKADAGRQLDEATRLVGDKTPPPDIEELRRQI
jgi:tetratricopeptide (TPR) repeat protein